MTDANVAHNRTLSKMTFGGTPKCKVCGKTAYPQEAIQYDNETYHKSCFNCLECKRPVSLSKVAMIKGDLYCKNCFIRMFTLKGQYHVFGEKTLPKAMGGEGESDSGRRLSAIERSVSPSSGGGNSTPKSSEAKPEPAKEEAKQVKPAFIRRPSVKSCSVEDCNAPRLLGKSFCKQHQEASENTHTTSENFNLLMKAVRAGNAANVKALISEHGVQVCLETSGGKTAVELAFTKELQPSCGGAMLEAIAAHIQGLEDAIHALQDEAKVDVTELAQEQVPPLPNSEDAPKPQEPPKTEA